MVREKKVKLPVKFIILEVPEDLHYQIKQQALFRHGSMKKYVLESIIERMKRDEKYL